MPGHLQNILLIAILIISCAIINAQGSQIAGKAPGRLTRRSYLRPGATRAATQLRAASTTKGSSKVNQVGKEAQSSDEAKNYQGYFRDPANSITAQRETEPATYERIDVGFSDKVKSSSDY